MQSISKHYLLLLYYILGIIGRGVWLACALAFMLLMVLYHMFPQGWVRVVWRDLQKSRNAYDTIFIRSFEKVLRTVR